MNSEIVAEIQGEYGPLTISEKMVQKIWARGDFRQTRLVTLEGKRLEILDLGTWNHLEGPDFKNVSIRIDEQLVNGDAELHFFDTDWEAHGHESDPGYRNVVLHILVFPPKQKKRSLKCSVQHSLLFIDLLPQGLESYAEEEVLGSLSAGDESALEEALLSFSLKKRIETLHEKARRRWKTKIKYAAKRIELLGWEEACHHTAMEILGYRYNRTQMLFLAGDYSLRALRTGSFSAASLYQAGQGRWKLRGSRPANYPRLRLEQYLDWVKSRPHWPKLLKEWASAFSGDQKQVNASSSRKQLRLAPLKKQLSSMVMADTVGGTRIENLVCDGFLPLLAAETGNELFSYWYQWYPGDVPSVLKQLFQRLGEGASSLGPASNGGYQGLIGCLLEN